MSFEPSHRRARQPKLTALLLPLALLGVGACTPAPPDDVAMARRAAEAAAMPEAMPAADPPLPVARDTAATLAELARRTAAIDADTAAMTRLSRPIDLGAGTTGVLLAWRTGPHWRRLRLEADGPGFSTIETYWLGTKGLLGARQETIRPGEPPRVDTSWFRDSLAYRWIDADGRRLNLETRSTQYLVEGLRARLSTLLEVLAETTAPPPLPN